MLCLARLAPALCLAAILGLASPTLAETRRVAVVVGNNLGGPNEKPLRWAEEDSAKVADVLAQLGSVRQDDLFVLKGRGKADLLRVMDRVAARLAELRRNPEDRTVLLFYYSGHSDGEALELGADRVAYTDLRAWLARSRADVRIAILDGCKSGALVQTKGGKRAAPFEIKLSDQLEATGEVLLTSSAADELALESREVRGSFFTHHFVSGLRGAADASGDGRVTLAEAYGYAFDNTIASAASTGVPQHPAYAYRLVGKGELVLTEVAQATSVLEFPAGFERALVLLVLRDQVLAELGGGGGRRLALAPGEYAIRLWKANQAYVGRVSVTAGEVKLVAWSDLRATTSPIIAGKGESPAETAALDGLSPEAQAAYLDGYLAFDDRKGGGALLLGRYGKVLAVDAFYEKVGRTDLASAYRGRKTAAKVLLGTSIAAAVGGLAWGVWRYQHRSNYFDNSGLEIMAYGGAAGAGLAVASFLTKPPAPPPDELRRLADDYNAALRRGLEPRKASLAPSIAIAPILMPAGGGVALVAAF